MVDIREHVPLAPLTTYRIGGPADRFAQPTSRIELVEALLYASDHALPHFVLGKGSNLLVSDSGYHGLIIDTSLLDTIEWSGNTVRCDAGALLHTLVRESVGRGFAGCQECAGIPGTIGGGLIMNAGAFSQTISDCCISAHVVNADGADEMELSASDISFGYRTSSLRDESRIVLDATFSFSRAPDSAALAASFEDILKRRREKQPLDLPNCGSVFKRPPGNFAGTLIEQCGLKGFTAGGARISEKHANFIINTGNANTATAEDVRTCIATAQQRVYEATGILLEPEVIPLGQFSVSLFTPSQES